MLEPVYHYLQELVYFLSVFCVRIETSLGQGLFLLHHCNPALNVVPNQLVMLNIICTDWVSGWNWFVFLVSAFSQWRVEDTESWLIVLFEAHTHFGFSEAAETLLAQALPPAVLSSWPPKGCTLLVFLLPVCFDWLLFPMSCFPSILYSVLLFFPLVQVTSVTKGFSCPSTQIVLMSVSLAPNCPFQSSVLPAERWPFSKHPSHTSLPGTSHLLQKRV